MAHIDNKSRQSKLYIEGITISGNSISLSDSTYNGGAIYSSDYQGGGIYNSNTLTISNATICGNTGFGGGIFNVGSIQILGSNSICDNESNQGPDNVFQMHGAVMDNEFYSKSEHP